jgi:retinol dehydrogenase 12
VCEDYRQEMGLRIDLLWIKALLQHNAKVYLACRNREKAQKAIEDLQASTGKEGHFLELDLADLNSVKACAKTFLR